MDFFIRFDVNIFSGVMLMVLYLTMKLRGEAKGTASRLFFRILWMTVFMLILEMLSWAFDGVPGKNGLNYFFNMIFAWSTSLTTGIIASYIDYHMFESYSRLKRRWFYIHNFIFAGILIVANLFYPILFSITPNNEYSREPLMILLPLMSLMMFLYISCLAYRNRKRIHREVIWVVLLYVCMPLLAAFFQVSVYGVFILWPFMAITLVLTYIFLETVSTSKDYLTGLFSRHRIDSYLEYMIKNKKPFTFVMIDLNSFKEINDTYGHLNGDLALKEFSKMLSKHFKDAKVVGRYAGDEFVLILEKIKREDIGKGFDNVKEEMEKLYKDGKLKFLVSFSYGSYERSENEDISYNDIIHFADKRMYEEKKIDAQRALTEKEKSI